MEYEINKIGVLEDELNRLIGWIQSVETRMAIVLTLSTAMLGAIAVFSPSFTKWTVLPAIITSFAAFFLVLSIFFSAFATFPRTSGPKGSLIYYGGIASMDIEQYQKAIKALDVEIYENDLIRQCHRNAQIAEKKYAWIQRSIACLFISSIPWAISIMLLYRLRP